MATHAPITGASTRAPGNVVPFQRRKDPLAFAPGVIPFDRINPDHIRVWNMLCGIGHREAARKGC